MLAVVLGLFLPAAAALAQLVTIGDLPPGKTVTVTFRSTVDSLSNGLAPASVSNQGTVSGTGFMVATDDPGTLLPGDATVTPFDSLRVSDQVWEDLNGNGTFDGTFTDAGIDGVDLSLFVDVNSSNTLDAADGAAIATTTTLGGGSYFFNGLLPGNYIVRIDASNFGAGSVLEGYVSIPDPMAGPIDPDNDVNHDDNGVDAAAPAITGIASLAITLAHDDETTADGTGKLDINDTLDFGLVNVADIEVSKSAPATVVAGSGAMNLTQEVTVTNNGPAGANGLELSEVINLPAGVTIDSITPSAGSYAPPLAATGTWTVGSLANGASETLTIVYTVGPSAADGATVEDTAAVSALAQSDPDNANDSDSASTTVEREVDLEVTKTDSADPVIAGDGDPGNLTYVVTVKNNGPSDASGVVLSEDLTLPAGVSVDSVTASAGSFATTVAPDGTWTVGDLDAGAMETLTVVLSVGPSAADGALVSNTAAVTAVNEALVSPNPTPDDATESTTIETQADLSVAKVDSVDPVVPGGTLIYTITVSNNGPSDAQDVAAMETLPGLVSFDATVSCGNDPAGVPSCPLGTIPAGDSAQYTVEVTLPAVVPAGVDLITNQVEVSSATIDPNGANDSVLEDTGILAEPDLTIDKSDGDTTSFPSGVIAYELTFDNVGNQGATGVKIVETVPAETTFDEAASGGAGVWSCADGAPATTTCEHLVGGLTGGGAGPSTVTFAVTVSGSVVLGTVSEISNTATIEDDGANGADPNPGDNSATDTTPLPADFGDAPDPLEATAGFYPTLVANDGARHAIRPVGDPLLIFLGTAVDADPDGQPSPPLTPAADGDDTDLDGDDEDGVTFLTGVVAGFTTAVEVTASAAGLLNAWVDFDVDGVFAPGEQVFSDEPLLAGVNSLSFTTPAGALTGPTADLLEGTFARFRFDSGGGLGPSGQATNGEVEDYFVGILMEADLAVTLTDQSDPIVAGDVQIYDLGVTNNGPAPATGVTLQHELPLGGHLLGVEPSSIDCQLLSGMLVECELGTIAAGATIDLRVGVLIDHRIDGEVGSEALAAGNELDPDPANDEADVTTNVARAREMIATTRAGARTLATIAKESDSTVGMIFADPAGGGDREYSVEAPGFRTTSLAEVPSFDGTASPEIASLAAGFGGETKVVVVDADSQDLLGDHDIAGSWLALDIVAVDSFAGTGAPELALLLRDPAGAELRVQVVDAASGVVERDHLIATSTPNPPDPDIVAPFPIGMAAIPSFGDTARPELGILTKNPDTGEVEVRVVDVDSGAALATHGQGTDLFPLGIVGLPDLALGGGTTAADLGLLMREASTNDLHVLVIDASNGTPFGPIDFDDTLLPGPLATVPSFAGGPAPELAVLGRQDPAALTLDLKDAATGAAVSSIAVGSPPLVPLPLGLAPLDSFAGGPSPELAVLFEFFDDDAQVQVFDGLGAGPLFTFFLP